MKFAITSRDGRTAAIIDAKDWPGDVPGFLVALRKGVTRWLDTTPDGQRHKLECRGHFTLSDLAGYVPDCFIKGTSLAACLCDQGIGLMTVEIADFDHDADLVDVHVDSNLYGGNVT
jgi:hypothetical protein